MSDDGDCCFCRKYPPNKGQTSDWGIIVCGNPACKRRLLELVKK